MARESGASSGAPAPPPSETGAFIPGLAEAPGRTTCGWRGRIRQRGRGDGGRITAAPPVNAEVKIPTFWLRGRVETHVPAVFRPGGLTDVSGLTGVEVLDLQGNALADVWPLAGLANIRRLDLSANRLGAAVGSQYAWSTTSFSSVVEFAGRGSR